MSDIFSRFESKKTKHQQQALGAKPTVVKEDKQIDPEKFVILDIDPNSESYTATAILEQLKKHINSGVVYPGMNPNDMVMFVKDSVIQRTFDNVTQSYHVRMDHAVTTKGITYDN